MTKFYLLLVLSIAMNVSAQDTTSFRLITTQSWGNVINFFGSDSINTTTVTASKDGMGFAIFEDPFDKKLWVVWDTLNDTERDLYRINPFSGELTFIHDFQENMINSADIADDGIIYAIYGNAATPSSQVITLDPSNGQENDLYLATDLQGLSRALEFNSKDSSLYFFPQGGIMYTYDLGAGTMTPTTMTGQYPGISSCCVHGAYYSVDNDNFITSDESSPMHLSDGSYSNFTEFSAASTDYRFDMTVFSTLTAEDTVGICPGDSTMIGLLYDGINSHTWYKDGVAMSNTSDTIYVSDAGTYQAVMEIGTTGMFHMWSEPIVVEFNSVPQVTITQAQNDSLICPGDTIVLSGAFGGSLQWYLDGTMIAGANSSTYAATSAGTYQQMKTNMSGCSDTADVAFVIYDDVNCDNGIDQIANSSLLMYPNPVMEMLTIQSELTIKNVNVYTVHGRKVMELVDVNKKEIMIDFEQLRSGSYLVLVENQLGVQIERIVNH